MVNKTIQKSENEISLSDSRKIQNMYSEKFKEFREYRFTSQSECAKYFEVSQPTISNIENGSRLPKQGLEIQIKKEWGLSLETVIDHVINGDDNFDTTSMQIIDMLKLETPGLSEYAKDHLLASAKHIIELDKKGDLKGLQSTELTKVFRAYGWSFTMRQLANHLLAVLSGILVFDRMVITRRHPNIPGSFAESLVYSNTLVWWNHWDNSETINKTEGIHSANLVEIFDKTDPMANEDMVITHVNADGDSHIFTNFKSSMWFPITQNQNEESLVLFTRHQGHEDGDFSVKHYEIVRNIINEWIPENVHF
tara:strand:+ start:94 stop:1020 length:927 start_codon:yes stop_codon:yes gene_type:complete